MAAGKLLNAAFQCPLFQPLHVFKKHVLASGCQSLYICMTIYEVNAAAHRQDQGS
jgi:hypothetical protein